MKMKGVFWKGSYSTRAASHLIAVGEDDSRMQRVLERLQNDHKGVHLFVENVEENEIISKTLKHLASS